MARNYAKEYANYHSRPEQIKKRSARNKARRLALKQGRVRIGDGLDVHHRDGNPLNNKSSNLTGHLQQQRPQEKNLINLIFDWLLSWHQ